MHASGQLTLDRPGAPGGIVLAGRRVTAASGAQARGCGGGRPGTAGAGRPAQGRAAAAAGRRARPAAAATQPGGEQEGGLELPPRAAAGRPGSRPYPGLGSFAPQCSVLDDFPLLVSGVVRVVCDSIQSQPFPFFLFTTQWTIPT